MLLYRTVRSGPSGPSGHGGPSGGGLYKATGHGVDDDDEKVLLNDADGFDGEEGHSTVTEVRKWVEVYEARNQGAFIIALIHIYA
jgi:hypothetical protein